jgi:hypothetical protein
VPRKSGRSFPGQIALFVMLSEAKHLGVSLGAGNPEILRFAQNDNDPLTRQWLLDICQRIREHCRDGGIFRQLFRHDFVQRVGGTVVIVEIKTAVLDRTESRYSGFLERFNIGAAVFNRIEHAGT